MITIEDGNTANLAKVESGTLRRPDTPLTVGQLELKLLARFPRADAESWDRMGILVGDPAARVLGVAVALDPTDKAIAAAHDIGANVLLTHHPAFLEPPAAISPSRDIAAAPGVNVYNAVALQVALMNFHTALDVSKEATRVLAGMLGLDFERILIPVSGSDEKGYGQLCSVRQDERPFKLEHLAARCTSVFGRMPRVWGDFTEAVATVAIANGSAGDVVGAALRAGADCLVCGEIRYHAALEAAQAGLAIVEVGHDASELPLVAVLARAAIDAGVDSADVMVLDQSSNWITPESTRI